MSGTGGPAHGPKHIRQGEERPRTGRVLLLVAGVVVLAAAGIGVVSLRHPESPSASANPKPKVVPLNVVSTTPVANATDVASNASLTVTFTTPLSPTSPMPTLSPAIAGSWTSESPTEVQFVATAPFVPYSQETITIPGGPDGMVGAKDQQLAQTVTVPFTVAQGSTLRLQELLAQLNYLPLSFTPTAPLSSPTELAEPQLGQFAWRWSMPASLTALWTQGTSNVITQAAVMSFENQHGLGTDGLAGPQVWTALLAATAANQVTTQPYAYVYVSENLPESATVYQNGGAVYSTPVNTGVPGADTAQGTFPVFARYTTATMSGTNVDGSKYVDPGIPWVSYFNGGDALHGYVRASYGFPQSNGCVEMPVANAAIVYPMTPLGTLVTVA